MNNDIKEILEQLEWYRKIGKKDVFYPEYVLSNKKAFMLLDYINNLQEENERLKELCDKYEEEHNTTFNYWKQLIKEDYKSRCEKAIEYIKDNLYYCVDNDDTNLLNILKGENNDI